jgi:hypothetical protein
MKKQAAVSIITLAGRETEHRGDEERKHDIKIKACERNKITHEWNHRRRQNARSDLLNVEHKFDMTEDGKDTMEMAEIQDVDT